MSRVHRVQVRALATSFGCLAVFGIQEISSADVDGQDWQKQRFHE